MPWQFCVDSYLETSCYFFTVSGLSILVAFSFFHEMILSVLVWSSSAGW